MKALYYGVQLKRFDGVNASGPAFVRVAGVIRPRPRESGYAE